MSDNPGATARLESVEAEQQLLGSILLDNSVFDAVSDIVTGDHFFDPVHQRIFELCKARITKNHLCSPISLMPILAADEGLNNLGGGAYLIRMAGASISGSFARDYARMIVEQAARRMIHSAAETALRDLQGGGESADVKMAVLHAMQAVPEATGEESSYSLAKTMVETVDAAVEAYQGNTQYLKTGIEPFDAIVKGLAPGDLCIIGGATSMGKTSLALEIASRICIDQRRGVAFVSLEMSRQELARRMAAARARVPYTDLRDAAAMDEGEFRKWVVASKEIASAPMRIIPKHIRDIPAIHAAARRAKRELGDAGLSVLIVDYAQLVRGTGKGRYEQMTEVSIGLKAMGSMLDCPVIALVQLSRDIGHRDDKRPQLSDIKETGQFENDADQVVFCHREDYWLERAGPKLDKSGAIVEQAKLEWEADLAAVRNTMELIVRKNRHGRLAMARIGFHPPTNRFWKLGGDVEQFE